MRIMLPIVPEGGHLYLQSDILHSLLKTKITDEIWSGRPIQYVRVFHQGPLIYTNGYVKIYNETDRPDRINRYFNITNPDCTDVKSITEVVVHGLKEGYYVQLNLDEYLIEKTYFSGRVHYCRNFLVYGFDDQKREIYAASHDRNTRYTVFVLTYKLLDEIYDAGIEGLPNQAHNRCQYIRLNDRLENDEAFQYSETKLQALTYFKTRIDEKDSLHNRQHLVMINRMIASAEIWKSAWRVDKKNLPNLYRDEDTIYDNRTSIQSYTLMEKQIDILDYLEQPHSLEEISKYMGISVETALGQIKYLCDKQLLFEENNCYISLVL